MPSVMQMQSISGIITQIHVTVEEVPPALVGASVNVIEDKVYVFAGRLATSRKMTNYLYVLDLNTLCWSRHIPPPDSDKPPKARYFHSASVYNKQLIIFGGMGYSRVSSDGLCVLDDVSVLDIETMCWIKPTIQPSLYSPQSRYAHLSAVTDDSKLVVLGGQDLDNNYLDELNVLNLKTWEWEQVKAFEKHVGAYRSIAVTAPPGTRLPTQEDHTVEDMQEDIVRPSLQSMDDLNPIYLYTNYNFADVKRELQLIYANTSTNAQAMIEDCSTFMNGAMMPPGLRFPTGHTLGNHMILAGTYLSPQAQSYSIWSLDLGKLTWSRIETGTVFNTGSWNRGVLHENTNRFLVFGNSNRSLLDDYNHRQVNFDHIAMVDLEAFGIYALPKKTCSSLAQEMGLRLLNEPAVSDFHIITQDNQSIPVNSAVLCQRWPYFANLMKDNHQKVNQKEAESNQKTLKQESIEEEATSSTSSLSLVKDINEPVTTLDDKEHEEEEEEEEEKEEEEKEKEEIQTQPKNDDDNEKEEEEEEEEEGLLLIKSHYMSFPYPHAVVIALLQYIYTDNLLTAQQYQPHILSQLLLLSDMYDIPRLRELATHALHQMLNMSTAPLIFETAALSHQTSLQIRALKMMIAAKKMIQQQQQLQQQQQTRSRTVSTPTAIASSSSVTAMDLPPPISPTASLSSSSYNTHNERMQYDQNIASNTASPTLQSFRARKPSINNYQPRASVTSSQQQRASTFSGMYSTTSRNTYSPPSTPRQQKSYPASELDSPRRSSSPPPPTIKSTHSNEQVKPIKEKKKKKAFLEAFGKFSSSISFQNNHSSSNINNNINNNT
jgi:hypothetical protein